MARQGSGILSRSIERKMLELERLGRQLGQVKDLLEESRERLRSLEKLLGEHERAISAEKDGDSREGEEVKEEEMKEDEIRGEEVEVEEVEGSVGDAEMEEEVEAEEMEREAEEMGREADQLLRRFLEQLNLLKASLQSSG